MQSIQVTQKVIQEISRGERRALLLVGGAQPFMVGDKVELINEKDSNAIGVLQIREITIKRLKDFPDHRDLLVGLEPDLQVNPDLIATKVVFGFQPHNAKQVLDETDVKKYTNVTEVTVYADGGSRGNPGPSAAGWVVYDMDGNILKSGGYYMGITTNNQAEYTALKLGLKDARKLGAREVNVYMDSMLVINQLKGIYRVKNKDLLPIYASIVEIVESGFERATFTHVPREKNKAADAMVNKVLDEIEESAK